MSVRTGQSITTEFTTRAFATGAATNADSTPTGTLYLNGTANGATVTVTNVATGLYKAAVTMPTLAVGDVVAILIAATVSSISDNAKIWEDSADVALDSSGRVLLQPTQTGVTIPTVTTLTNLPAAPTDWLTAAAVKADAVTKIQSGLSTLTASGVWSNGTRTLTSLSGLTLDTVTTVSNAVTLTSAYDAAKTALTVSGYTAPDNASIVLTRRAVYDTLTAAGDVLTLSNGATQTIDSDGNRTTAGP